MNINKNSLTKAVVISLIFTCMLGISFFVLYTKIYDSTFFTLWFLSVFLQFFGLTYWMYQRIEYDRITWKGEKRSWYGWVWWPSRKWSEAYYWTAITRITIVIPLIIFFWFVFIYGYSFPIGIIVSLPSLFIIIFTMTELDHWWGKKQQQLQETFSPRTYNKGIIVMFVLIFILLIIAVPYIEEPKGNYQNYITEQRFVGTWQNENITLTVAQNHTCIATYNHTTYSGRWTLVDVFGWFEISWDQEFSIPRPDNTSSFLPIEMVFLINGGTHLSLYQPFSASAYFTLEKV